MKVFSKEMNQAYLSKLKREAWFPRIESILLRGDPPSEVRKNLESAGLSSEQAHQLVKNLWNLQNSKFILSDEIVDYLREHGLSQDQFNDEFCPLQLAVGALVEFEHTDDFDAALEIAKDHLAEDEFYYGEPKFKEEAVERIASIQPEDYQTSEALEAVSSWREKFNLACAKALLSSGKSYLHLGPLCVCSSGTVYQTGDDLVDDYASQSYEVDGKLVWVDGEDGTLKILTPDEVLSVYPEDSSLPLEYTLSQYLNCDPSEIRLHDSTLEEVDLSPVEASREYVLPVKVSNPIQSMSMKTTEEYYKTGLLTKKEVVAILTKENDWSPEEANQIADFWERCYSSMAFVKISHSFEDGFTPSASYASAAVADILSSQTVTTPSELKALLQSYAIESAELEPILQDRASDRGLLFTALDYYAQAGVVPSFKDYLGYLKFTGEFEDNKKAYVSWKKLCKELNSLDDLED